MEKIKEKLEIAKKYLIENYNCEAIILFGSYARNAQREDSDIDLAIKTDENIESNELFTIKNELEDILEKDVDLINLKNTQDGIRYEILINGTIIYVKDELKFELYKLDMYREYLELNENRKQIVDNIKKGEKSYGE